MQNIFVYGTLLNEEILKRLLNCVPQMDNATLHGFKRVQVEGEAYPAIRPDSESLVNGAVLYDISDHQLLILDDYESFHYQRKKVDVVLIDNRSIKCQTYVYKPQYYRCLLYTSPSPRDA